MEIQFIQNNTGELLFEIESDDAPGIIAAAVNGNGIIELLDGSRRYKTHKLSFYKENEIVKPYIKIYIE